MGLLPRQGFGPEAKTRGGIIVIRANIEYIYSIYQENYRFDQFLPANSLGNCKMPTSWKPASRYRELSNANIRWLVNDDASKRWLGNDDSPSMSTCTDDNKQTNDACKGWLVGQNFEKKIIWGFIRGLFISQCLKAESNAIVEKTSR